MYEPILRIMTACGYKVECEYECPNIQQPKRGDKKRLDFYATGKSREIALEVKWLTSTKPVLTRDIEKLRAVFESDRKAFPLLCLFGRQTFVANVDISGYGFVERGRAVYADFRRTKYACRVYELTKPAGRRTPR